MWQPTFQVADSLLGLSSGAGVVASAQGDRKVGSRGEAETMKSR